MVGSVQEVECRVLAELFADRLQKVQIRQFVARAAEEEHRDRDRAEVVRALRVGLAGLMRGKEKKTRPCTPSRGVSEAAVEVMRPPKEWPPARRRRSVAAMRATATAARTVAVQTSRESRPLPCSMYGKL